MNLHKHTFAKGFYGLMVGLLLLGLFPFTSGIPTALAGDTNLSKLVVDNQDTSALVELTSTGGILIADYKSFSVWQANPSQVSRLLARDSVTIRSDYDVIGLRDSVIDSRTATPQVPQSLRQDKTSGYQFWMVQFAGPIKDEWLNNLKAIGIETVIYMPNNAYVVWANGAGLAELENSVGKDLTIQWTGAYHPAYRLSPTLKNGKNGPAKTGAGTTNITVQFYNTPNVGASLTALSKFGGQVYELPSNVLNFVDVSLAVPTDKVGEIATWNDVFNVEPWFAPTKNDEAQNLIISGNITTSGGNVVPTNTDYLGWLGSKGFPTTPSSYPVVDVVDDGVDNGTNNPLHPDFHVGGILANPSRVVTVTNCTTDASANGADGHGNINTGIIGGFNNQIGQPYEDPANGFNRGLGVSPYGRMSNTKFFRTGGTSDSSACGGTYSGLVQSSYSHGAAISSNSWGASGAAGGYVASSQAYDALTRDATSGVAGNQEMLHVFANGNSGAGGASTVGAPATAKNVLSVGGTENVRDDGVADGCGLSNSNNADDIYPGSSRGPTTDGRVKPDIVAPAIHVQGPASQDPSYNGDGVCGAASGTADPRYYPNGTTPPSAPFTQTLYTWSSGTSHSTPAAAGSASLIYNYYNRVIKPGFNPSPAMIKALMINGARYLNGSGTGGTLPSNNQGYGDVNNGATFDSTVSRFVVDQTSTFGATGDNYTKTGVVADGSKALRVTVAWSDAPGSTTGNSYVNDLNLEVTVNGSTYKGNVYSGATSTTGSSFDAKNNVESVFLTGVPTGAAIAVKVTAANISGDGLPGNADTTDQDFALVITNVTPQAAAVVGVSNQVLTQVTGNGDSVYDPGEVFNGFFAITNSGDLTATNVSASLTATTGATVTGNPQNYGTINPSQTVTNSSPFVITFNPSAPCGSTVTFTLNISYGATGTSSYVFAVQIGQPAPYTTYNSTDVPKSIPDNTPAGITSTLNVTATGTIGKIRVRVNVTHTWDGDLIFKLTAPNGVTTTLINRRGSSGENFFNTVLDDSASVPISSGTAPFTGSYRPESPLSTLVGLPKSGTWTLNIADVASRDTGTLSAWSIDLGEAGYVCAGVTGGFHPIPQFRLYDSRTASGGPGPFVAGETRTITAVNNTGISSNPTTTVKIPTSAKSVVVNFTAVQVSKGGFLTAYQTGITQPTISTLNWYYANQIVANSAIVDLNSAGQFNAYFGASAGDLTVDVVGYIDNQVDGPAIPPSNPLSGVLTTTALTYKPVSSVLTSVRSYDSRVASGGPGPLSTGATRTVQIRGTAGVPATAKAVVINLTAINAVNRGFLAAFPGTSNPGTASVSFNGSVQPVIGNLVVVYLDSAGAITVLAGGTGTSADFAIDVFGYYDNTDLSTGGYVGLPAPVRHYDSRTSSGGSGPISAGTTISAPVSVKLGTSTPTGVPTNARAVVIHLAVANTVSNGFLALYGVNYQGTSSLNWAGANQLVSNLAMVDLAQLDNLKVKAGGNAAAQADFIIDIVGYIP